MRRTIRHSLPIGSDPATVSFAPMSREIGINLRVLEGGCTRCFTGFEHFMRDLPYMILKPSAFG
jgi:hypothetical protein